MREGPVPAEVEVPAVRAFGQVLLLDARAQAIEELLDGGFGATAEESRALQGSVLSIAARELVPLMTDFAPQTERQAKARDLLLGWDFQMRAETPQPLIFDAWLIALTTAAFGDSEFAIRLSAPLLHAVAAGIVYAIGARLYDRRIGFWSALAYLTAPGTSLSSYIISTDAALLPCWAAARQCR